MNKKIKITLYVLVALLLIVSWPTYQLYDEISKSKSEDPQVWEEAILDFERQQLSMPEAENAVVVFAGTNDVHPGTTKTAQILLERYQQFIDIVREDLLSVPVYYIAITPSIMRWEVWGLAQKTNQLIETYSLASNNLFYIGTADALLVPDGTPDKTNYRFEGLHLSEYGYRIWTEIIQ